MHEIIPDKQLIVVGEPIRSIMEDLSAIGCKALIVGGAVRDAILGIEPKDFDIEVYNISYGDLETFLRSRGKHVDLVGKAFGIIKFRPDDGGQDFDISIPRRESKIGVGHKEFEVTCDPSMSIKDAALRRDFSWNALAYNPIENKIYDYFGGIEDLNNKVIRHTSVAFSEDPLRCLRALQFQARFGFTIHLDTIQAMRDIVASGDFESLPKERVFDEWMKWATKGVRHDLIFQFLRDTNLIDYYPELKALKTTRQDHVYHPEGDVEIHTTLCLREMDRIIEREKITGKEKAILILSILLHDIGKPTTSEEVLKLDKTTMKERLTITSHGHEALGGTMVREFLPRLGFHEELVDPIAKLVADHLASVSISCIPARSGKLKAVKRLSRRLYPATIQQLLLVIEADHNGRGSDMHKDAAGSVELLELAKEVKVQDKPYEYILMGRHLIAEGLKPGPEFGVILRESYEAQESGEFSDEISGIQWLKNRLSKQTHIGVIGGGVSGKQLLAHTMASDFGKSIILVGGPMGAESNFTERQWTPPPRLVNIPAPPPLFPLPAYSANYIEPKDPIVLGDGKKKNMGTNFTPKKKKRKK